MVDSKQHANPDVSINFGYMHDPEKLIEIVNNALLKMSANVVSFIPKQPTRKYTCSIAGCEALGYSKGLCNAHYVRKRNNMDMTTPVKNRKRGAKCTECGDSLNGKGGWNLCKKHYRNERIKIIKNILIEHMGGKCCHCKNSYPNPVYDFHHTANDKIMDIARMFNCASIRRIVYEASKCILLCANCHRLITSIKHTTLN